MTKMMDGVDDNVDDVCLNRDGDADDMMMMMLMAAWFCFHRHGAVSLDGALWWYVNTYMSNRAVLIVAPSLSLT